MTTHDILAMGCEVLGLKGAKRYDDYNTMIATWHDKAEPIPTEAAIVAAGTAWVNVATAEKTTDDTERSNAQTALSTLAQIRDNAAFTNATRDSSLRAIARVLIWIVKRELKR